MMKLDNSTKKILMAGFEQSLKEHGEKMRYYMKYYNDGSLPDSTMYWEEAMEIERNLIELLNNILDQIKED